MSKSGRSALVATYLERRADLARFFARRLRSEAAAEDLVQEIYVRLARVDEDAQIDNPASYLYRLGTNLMLEQMRGQRRAAARDAAWSETSAMRLGDSPVVDEASADDALAARQRLAAVVRAVGELPLGAQAVFRLHKLQGLSHAETAARLGVSRSAVEKRMIAVLKHLALRLGDPAGGAVPSAASSPRKDTPNGCGNDEP